MYTMTEVWPAHAQSLRQLLDEKAIETPSGIGGLGESLWFMRRKTATEYPSFLSYLGLRGEENRPKLAEVFKRPTTWMDYCTYVSKDSCTTPDKYSSRKPSSDAEGSMYYVDGDYTGYFRATERNDCTRYPNNCTGHIVDYPCGWGSFVIQQTHHLGIALESNGNQPGVHGYAYSEMVQIWTAANKTDSHVLMQWWRPESLYQEFLGSDSEFHSVALPPPTQTCIDHRIDPFARCEEEDPNLLFGDPRGSCMEAPQNLLKAISKSLKEISFDSGTASALHSPAYDAVSNIRISELQIGQIFEYWFSKSVDKWGLDPRDATCQWVLENIDTLRSFIPSDHPRVVKDTNLLYKQSVIYVAMTLACMAICASLCATVVVIILRDKPAMRYSQVEFVILLLLGLLLVSVGSLLTVLNPTDRICVGIAWLVNLGYTLELVPLIVKVAAINQLVMASEQMRRINLRKESLFGTVLLFCLSVGLFLIIWTIIDPPRRNEEYELTSKRTESGVTVIERVFFCGSENDAWNFLGISLQALLLLCASILAFQARIVREDLNDTKTLAMMIYSHMVLVILRAMTYALEGSLDLSDLAAARSIIFSIDVLTTIVLYFSPKFLRAKRVLNTGVAGAQPENPPLTVHEWRAKTFRSTPSVSFNVVVDSALSSDNPDRVSSLHVRSSDFRTEAEAESTGVLHVVSEEIASAMNVDADDDDDTRSNPVSGVSS